MTVKELEDILINYDKDYNCKHCKFFGVKNRDCYWCYAPEVQSIKKQDLLQIKEEEIEERYCECFERKLI